jgi:lipopolysaccharide heptosyltransferase II
MAQSRPEAFCLAANAIPNKLKRLCERSPVGKQWQAAENMRRLLIIHYTAGLGDHLLCYPAIALFKKTFPEWEIHVVSHPATAAILSYFPEVDQVPALDTSWAWPWHRRRRYVYEAGSRTRQLLHFLNDLRMIRRQHYDRICHLVSTSNVNSVRKAKSLNFLLGHDVNSGFPPPTPASAYNETRRAAWCLIGRDVGEDLKPARIVPRWEAEKWVSEVLQAEGVDPQDEVIGISLGSANPLRRWLASQFADLVCHLRAARPSSRIVLMGLPAERGIYESIRSQVEGKSIDAVGKTDLHQLIALIARCRIVVANDSAVMHIAAATGQRLVAIFGSGDRLRTMPLVSNATVACDSGDFDCKPCYRPSCPHDRRCMKVITVQRVLEAVEFVANSSSPTVATWVFQGVPSTEPQCITA